MVDQRNLSSTLAPDLYEIRIESPSDLHCHRVLINRVKLKKRKRKRKKKKRKENKIEFGAKLNPKRSVHLNQQHKNKQIPWDPLSKTQQQMIKGKNNTDTRNTLSVSVSVSRVSSFSKESHRSFSKTTAMPPPPPTVSPPSTTCAFSSTNCRFVTYFAYF
jgi:hypothetical protein